MKQFRECLRQQLHNHSSMTPQDVVKLCYQAACGAEHLLSDTGMAKAYFDKEFASVEERYEPLYERISDGICRVNLGAWKQTGMPSEWLFRMFANTVFRSDGKERLVEYVAAAEAVLYSAGYDLESWKDYLIVYEEQGMPAVRHSEQYRERENPAYRIVGTEYLKLFPILQKIAESDTRKNPYVIAIDGRAGAGKSALAAMLQTVLDADAVYMDDFFLPPTLRTEERLAQVGGNIHYERFAQQVVPYLSGSKDFNYDIFDCGCMDYNGVRIVSNQNYRIVEGSYSHHPYFGAYMDLRVFVDVNPKEQMRRIRNRNGEELAEMFRTKWIPMENLYFETYGTRERADVVIR